MGEFAQREVAPTKKEKEKKEEELKKKMKQKKIKQDKKKSLVNPKLKKKIHLVKGVKEISKIIIDDT